MKSYVPCLKLQAGPLPFGHLGNGSLIELRSIPWAKHPYMPVAEGWLQTATAKARQLPCSGTSIIEQFADVYNLPCVVLLCVSG